MCLRYVCHLFVRHQLFFFSKTTPFVFTGPTGLLLACGLGLLRTTYGDPDVVSDFTPVDTSIKAMIVAAWKRGVESEVSEIPVYNCSTSLQRKFTTGFIVEMGKMIERVAKFFFSRVSNSFLLLPFFRKKIGT